MTTRGLERERVGLTANPRAGRGEVAVASVIRGLFERLAVGRWVLTRGTLEARIAAEFEWDAELVVCEGGDRDARVAASALLGAGVEVLIGVGGDGTMCDIAAAMRGGDRSVRLLGVGVGSANVGPLVCVHGREIERLAEEPLRESSVHGIEVRVNGEFVGVAFNDVVFANSFFGTRDGRRIDLDAAASLGGEDRTIEPASVCGPGMWIAKNGRPLVGNEAGEVMQVIASPVNDAAAYAGMAVSGFLCWGPYVGKHAILSAASAVMIRTRLEAADLEEAEPLRLTQIGFGEGDRVDVGGLRDEAVVVLDGNPMRRLVSSDVVSLEAKVDVVRTLRPGSYLLTEQHEMGWDKV